MRMIHTWAAPHTADTAPRLQSHRTAWNPHLCQLTGMKTKAATAPSTPPTIWKICSKTAAQMVTTAACCHQLPTLHGSMRCSAGCNANIVVRLASFAKRLCLQQLLFCFTQQNFYVGTTICALLADQAYHAHQVCSLLALAKCCKCKVVTRIEQSTRSTKPVCNWSKDYQATHQHAQARCKGWHA